MIDENNEFIIDEDNMVMEYCGDGGNVVIPDGIKDIFFQAFYGNFKIESVIIPGSVKEVAPVVFEMCSSLKEVFFNDGIVSIGACSFNCCEKLETINFPKSIKIIESFAFSNCPSLKQIRYAGSKSDWELVVKKKDWDKDSGDYGVIYNCFC